MFLWDKMKVVFPMAAQEEDRSLGFLIFLISILFLFFLPFFLTV